MDFKTEAMPQSMSEVCTITCFSDHILRSLMYLAGSNSGTKKRRSGLMRA